MLLLAHSATFPEKRSLGFYLNCFFDMIAYYLSLANSTYFPITLHIEKPASFHLDDEFKSHTETKTTRVFRKNAFGKFEVYAPIITTGGKKFHYSKKQWQPFNKEQCSTLEMIIADKKEIKIFIEADSDGPYVSLITEHIPEQE